MMPKVTWTYIAVFTIFLMSIETRSQEFAESEIKVNTAGHCLHVL